jgi:hypothetical protein
MSEGGREKKDEGSQRCVSEVIRQGTLLSLLCSTLSESTGTKSRNGNVLLAPPAQDQDQDQAHPGSTFLTAHGGGASRQVQPGTR